MEWDDSGWDGLMDYCPPMNMWEAVDADDAESVTRLYKAGVLVEGEGTNQTGVTPLMVAAREGKMKAARALISHGADINRQNDFGITPLIFAAIQGQAEMVAFLLENGADIDICENGGNTALDNAKRQGYDEVVQLLKNFLETRQRRIEEEAAAKEKLVVAWVTAAQRHLKAKAAGGRGKFTLTA